MRYFEAGYLLGDEEDEDDDADETDPRSNKTCSTSAAASAQRQTSTRCPDTRPSVQSSADLKYDSAYDDVTNIKRYVHHHHHHHQTNIIRVSYNEQLREH